MPTVVKSLSSSETDAKEWRLRCDMAAVFRICARHHWNEQIGNHNSLMLPRSDLDDAPLFMINPRGCRFEELTASTLIVCDLDGRVVRGKGELRKVAFHIHARIHLRNEVAACVLHVHPQYLTAISMLEMPRLALAHHNNLMLNDRVIVDTHGDEPVDDNSEGDRIADLMGDKTVMIMASHGVTVVGPTVHDAFDELFIGRRCTRSPRCRPGRNCAHCQNGCAGIIMARGAAALTRGFTLMPGGASWIGTSRTMRADECRG